MTHDHAEALLLDLVYGELPPEEARELERHAAQCSSCAAELERLRATRRIAARLHDEPVPIDRRSELREAARRATAPARPRRPLRARVYALAASAAVLAVVAGVTLRLSGAPPAVSVRDQVVPPGADELASRRDTRAAGEERATTEEPATVRERATAQSAPPARPRAPAAERSPVAEHAPTMERERAPAAPPAPAVERAPTVERAPVAERGAASRSAPAGAPSSPVSRSADAKASASEVLRAPEAPASSSRAEDFSAAGTLVADIERRIAAGQLHRETARIECDGMPVERTAWFDGDAVAKLVVRGSHGAVEGWYDSAGHLLSTRRDGADPLPAGGEPAAAAIPALVSPERAPTRAALARCSW